MGYIIAFIFGGIVGILIVCLISINRSELSPGMLQRSIQDGLKGRFTFYLSGTGISITPLEDGSGIIRVKKEEIK